MKKLLIICGPTVIGKTALGLLVAKQFDGELLSADSRQIYRGLDIGTGKDVGESKIQGQKLNVKVKGKQYDIGYYEVDGVRIWGLDLVNPDEEFSVSHYKEIAQIIIDDIRQREKLPIVVGGTGLYIKALIEDIDTINIPQNKRLREELNNKNITQLQYMLRKTNLDRWDMMNNSDKNNPRRLIRAIEVEYYLGKIGDVHTIKKPKREENNVLFIGLTAPKEYLYARIDKRVDQRARQGIVEEIKGLLKRGYSWKLSAMSGLGYREIKDYLEGSKTLAETIEKWKLDERAYACRQLTWFRKQKAVVWFDIIRPEYPQVVIEHIKSWYTLAKDNSLKSHHAS